MSAVRMSGTGSVDQVGVQSITMLWMDLLPVNAD